MAGIQNRRNTSVTVKDGAGVPLSRTVGPGPGDFKASNLQQGNYEAMKVLDRGQFSEMVPGDDAEIKISGSIYVSGDQTGSSVVDAILKTGDWSSATTTDPGGQVWAFTLVITESYAGVTNIYTFSKCRGTASWSEDANGNKLDFDVTCLGGCVRS